MAGLRFCKTTIALLFVIAFHVVPSTAVLFTDLTKSLIVTASPAAGAVLHAGEDEITVTWALNTTATADTANYKSVKVLLCYAPISQVDRKWRKTNNDLKKDKTCQFKVVQQPYDGAGNHTYLIDRAVPSAFYFVRAYALDASDNKVGFGQTTNKEKKDMIFQIVGISGRTVGIDISAAVFSAFSVAAVVYFYIVENKKRK